MYAALASVPVGSGAMGSSSSQDRPFRGATWASWKIVEPSLIVGSECVTRSPLMCDTVLKPPVEAQVRGGG